MSNLPERVTASMRAADVDRMRVAQLLSDAAAQGRLELSEFEQRLAKVYSANTYGELDQLSADLPDVATSPVRGQGSKPAPSTVLMAIMSGFERRGRWNVCPGAILDDGLLDVTVVAAGGRLRLLRLSPTVYKGTHVDLPEVSTFRSRRVRLYAADITAYADGDPVAPLPVDIDVVPAALSVFA